MEEPTMKEKEEAIKEYYGFGNGTIQYFKFYKWGNDLIDKLYEKAKNH